MSCASYEMTTFYRTLYKTRLPQTETTVHRRTQSPSTERQYHQAYRADTLSQQTRFQVQHMIAPAVETILRWAPEAPPHPNLPRPLPPYFMPPELITQPLLPPLAACSLLCLLHCLLLCLLLCLSPAAPPHSHAFPRCCSPKAGAPRSSHVDGPSPPQRLARPPIPRASPLRECRSEYAAASIPLRLCRSRRGR